VGGAVFPGSEDATWTFQPEAGRWYSHRFYAGEPDLNTDHPAVREEFRKILGFWSRLGVAGFRVDAVPFLIESRADISHSSSVLRGQFASTSFGRGKTCHQPWR
jgi:maltose alpha-D-glucosyltransferase/alpha-amylase